MPQGGGGCIGARWEYQPAGAGGLRVGYASSGRASGVFCIFGAIFMTTAD